MAKSTRPSLISWRRRRRSGGPGVARSRLHWSGRPYVPSSSSADRRGELEDTEDQLFRFARFVESNPDLRNVLADRSIDRSRRQELVGELLRGRATDVNDRAREASRGRS